MAYICNKSSCKGCNHCRKDDELNGMACWKTYDDNHNTTESIDRSSNIIENLKWFLYDDGSLDFISNEFGFEHNTEFVSWVGDGHSFIIKDDSGEYRITISKELE